jgi:hypothetical protein
MFDATNAPSKSTEWLVTLPAAKPGFSRHGTCGFGFKYGAILHRPCFPFYLELMAFSSITNLKVPK